MPLKYELTDILNFTLVELCMRPARQLLYGSISFLLDFVSDGRQFMMAYKLEDPKFQRHPVFAE